MNVRVGSTGGRPSPRPRGGDPLKLSCGFNSGAASGASAGVMRHAILLSMFAIAAVTGCGRQTTTTSTPPKAKTMSYTLDICGGKTIQNPTESDLRQAVFALDTKRDEAFLILGATEMTYIQTTGDQ